MTEVSDLHREAMAFAEEAAIQRLRGNTDRAMSLFRRALEKERAAAALVEADWSLEPTRSVLHRSAASLAFECGELHEATLLIAAALSGSPPEEIAQELYELRQSVAASSRGVESTQSESRGHGRRPLTLDGPFYPRFTGDEARFRSEDHSCIRRTVERLLSTETTVDHPGMLLGKIQSGKTKTFLGVVALAFDNAVDVAVILTKGTRALSSQTVTRVRNDFAAFIREDRLQVFDIMEVPGLTGYELNQKLIFVAKKQADNLDRLKALFGTKYPILAKSRVLLIDDEADYASIGFKRTKDEGIVINKTSKQINGLREHLESSAFLQVTATPYSLYLQPEDLAVKGIEFRPVRPAFTELVPVHRDYVGSDYYFDESRTEGTVASCLFQAVTRDELEVLAKPDRRRFKPEDCLDSQAVAVLRTALCNFIVGGCIRRLQNRAQGTPEGKFSFLFHTEAQKAAHAWQENVVLTFNDKLTEAATARPERLGQLFGEAFDDLRRSIELKGHLLPPREEVIVEAIGALTKGWLMVTKVNSEKQIVELLDDTGQLKLRTPLNLFIGGQILDRGVTIASLIGFFYGRRPNVYQQDTVLQHSRMFGFRPIEDLTVTRFYTEPAIFDAMRRMHESDVALRESIARNPDEAVIFIQQDEGGRILPCSPNKILVSRTTTLRPFKRILPVGFQTDSKTRVEPAVKRLDDLVARHRPSKDLAAAFRMPLSVATQLLELIKPTLIMEPGYDFNWEAASAALKYLSDSPAGDSERGTVWCLVREERSASRFVAGARRSFYDSPDTSQREGAIAREVALNSPMLMLFRQNGLPEQGWRGTPFFWPVIWVQKNVKTAIFAQETMA
jgi:hypothetical protein